MNRIFLISVISFFTVSSCNDHSTASIAAAADTTAIKAVLDSQTAAWNRGNTAGFMEGYLKSDSLIFLTTKGTTRGWKNVLEKYRKSYPTPEAMGRLTFTGLQFSDAPLLHSQLVTGKWQVVKTQDTFAGRFALYFQKSGNSWRIVADHTW